MARTDAMQFVDRMKADPEFRQKVLKEKAREGLDAFLHGEKMVFTRRELIFAMAECMAQMEQQK